jgi:hypothetical protein
VDAKLSAAGGDHYLVSHDRHGSIRTSDPTKHIDHGLCA